MNFLPQRHRQPVKLLQRNNHRANIENDVQNGCKPALEVDVVALGLVLLVPGSPSAVNWSALEDGNELKGDEVCDIEADEDPACQSNMFAREYLQIEKQDGNLCDGQGSEIEKFVPVEQLGVSVT